MDIGFNNFALALGYESYCIFVFKDFIYLFILERGEGKEKERERNIKV